MFGENFDLEESKLLLLYILNRISDSLSNIEITEIALQNNLMSYFALQNYLNDMIDSGLLKYTEELERKKLLISDSGKEVLSLFFNRISDNKKKLIDNYLSNKFKA